MLNPRHFMRAKRWVQNPPSLWRVKLVFAVIAIGLLIAGIERLGLWPDWATTERIRKPF